MAAIEMDNVDGIIEALTELLDDSTIPKNVKAKMQNAINHLKANGDRSMSFSKAMHELEELAEDVNIEPFTRSQILNIVSLLEKTLNS